MLQEIIRLTSRDEHGSLLRIVPYQHLVWACEVGTSEYFVFQAREQSFIIFKLHLPSLLGLK